MGQRIKGQEIEVGLVAGNRLRAELNDIRSFEMEYQLEILAEGYLGETTKRRDAVFNGISGSMSIHCHDQEILVLATEVVAKARRRGPPDYQVNIKVTLNFPNGQRPRIIIPNCELGALPIKIGGRTEYLEGTVSFEAEQANTIAV